MLIPIILPSWLARIVRIVMAPFFVLFGLLLAGAGYWGYEEQKSLQASGVAVHATVVSAHEGTDGLTYLNLHYDVGGSSFDREEPGIEPGIYDESGAIDILCDPDAPQIHRIVGTERGFGSFLGQIAGGLGVIVLAVLMFLVSLGARVTRT